MFKYLRITLTGPGRCLKRPLWRGITAHLRHMQQSDNHSGGAATAAIYPNPGLVPVFFAAEQISTPRYIPRPSSETGHAKASRRAYTYECTCSFHFFALSCVLFSGLPLFPWPPPTSPVDFKCQADLISLALYGLPVPRDPSLVSVLLPPLPWLWATSYELKHTQPKHWKANSCFLPTGTQSDYILFRPMISSLPPPTLDLRSRKNDAFGSTFQRGRVPTRGAAQAS